MAPRPQPKGASLDEIERVYRARLPELRRVAAAIAGDAELARDSVQEAFAMAVRRRASFTGAGPLEAWLWRIVVNATRDLSRSARRAASIQEPPRPLANGHRDAAADRVRASLALLPERQRLILFLHYYADLDYATIAGVLEISPGTVGATLHSARASLRRHLEEAVHD
jgi:RNA polymerase sigma-70 factor (ECF subfamily)